MEKKYNINTNCCTHYNGTNTYTIGHIFFHAIKIALCNDCNEIQIVSKGLFGFIAELLMPFWNGKVYLSNKTIKI